MKRLIGPVTRTAARPYRYAVVVDVAGDRCSVDLVGGRRLSNIRYIGGVPVVGTTVKVEWETGEPVVKSASGAVSTAAGAISYPPSTSITYESGSSIDPTYPIVVARGDTLYGTASLAWGILPFGSGSSVLTAGSVPSWSSYYLQGFTGHAYSFPDISGSVVVNNQANTFTVGPQTIQTGADANKGLIIKANSATQSGSMFEIQDSTAYALLSVDANGNVGMGTTPDAYRRLKVYKTVVGGTYGIGQELYAIGSGGTTYLYGAQYTSYSVGEVNTSAGMVCNINLNNAGSTTWNGIGLYVFHNIYAGTVDKLYAVRYDAPYNAGTINYHYGIYLNNVAGGVTSNYAIYTNTGLNRLGDQLSIVGSADRVQLLVTGFTTQTSEVAQLVRNDAVLNAVSPVLRLTHNTTGTADVGFGSSLVYYLESATTADQLAARMAVSWVIAAHATRTSRVAVSLISSATEVTPFTIDPNMITVSYDAGNYSSFQVSSSGNLTVRPTGDFIFDPDSMDILPNLGYELNIGSLTKKYLTLHAAELWVETLVAQNTIATIGGRILVGPTSMLTRDLSSGSTHLYSKYNQMTGADIIHMEAGGQNEFMRINGFGVIDINDTGGIYYFMFEGDHSSDFVSGGSLYIYGSVANDGTYSIFSSAYASGSTQIHINETPPATDTSGSCAWVSSGSEGFHYLLVERAIEGGGAHNWSAGDALFNTRTTGRGWIDLYSIGSMRGTTEWGPAIVGNVRSGSVYNDWGARWAIGNLDGIYGYSGSIMGAAFGPYVSGSANLTVDETNGLRLRTYDTNILQISNSDGKGYITGPLYLDTAGGIYQGGGTFATPTSGLKIYNNSGSGMLATYQSGSQVVIIGGSGLAITAHSISYNRMHSYRFITPDNLEMGGLYGASATSQHTLYLKLIADGLNYVSGSDTRLDIQSRAVSPCNAIIQLTAYDGVSFTDLNMTEDIMILTAPTLQFLGDLMSFYGETPVAKASHIADATGTLSDVVKQFNDLLVVLEDYGLLKKS